MPRYTVTSGDERPLTLDHPTPEQAATHALIWYTAWDFVQYPDPWTLTVTDVVGRTTTHRRQLRPLRGWERADVVDPDCSRLAPW